MKLLFKWLKIPQGEKQIEAYQSWEVRWGSIRSEYQSGLHPEVEIFPTKEAAHEFADALRNAFELLKFRNVCEVKVKYTGSKLVELSK